MQINQFFILYNYIMEIIQNKENISNKSNKLIPALGKAP